MTLFLEENYLSNKRLTLSNGQGVSSILVDDYECADGSKVGDVLRIDEEVTVKIGKVGFDLGKRPPVAIEEKSASKKVNGTDQKPKKEKPSEEFASVGKISYDMSMDLEEPAPITSRASDPKLPKDHGKKKPVDPISNDHSPKKPVHPKPAPPEKESKKPQKNPQIPKVVEGKQSPISKSPAPSHLKVDNETSESITSEEKKPAKNSKPPVQKVSGTKTQPELAQSLFGAFAGQFGAANIDFGNRMAEEPLGSASLQQPILENTNEQSAPQKAPKPKKPKTEVKSGETAPNLPKEDPPIQTPAKDADPANPGKKRGRPKKNPEAPAEPQQQAKVDSDPQNEQPKKPSPPKAKKANKVPPVSVVENSDSSSSEEKAPVVKPTKKETSTKPKENKKETSQKQATKELEKRKASTSEESSEQEKTVSKPQANHQSTAGRKSADSAFKTALSGGSETSSFSLN